MCFIFAALISFLAQADVFCCFSSAADQALAVAVEARLQAVMALHPTPGGKMTVLNDLNGKADKKASRLGRPGFRCTV